MAKPPVICLMGPTASGKTGMALRLHDSLPVDIISVDSALVYRGMDIGTAKPDAATLAAVPHRLIDIRDPEEPYSAGEFIADAVAAIHDIHAAGRIPLLAGGTMMYFRALTRGLADLPSADAEVRAELEAEAAETGWPAMHAKLAAIDAAAASRIDANDSQRIQRALEVFRLSGRPLSDWQADTRPAIDNPVISIALLPAERAIIHERIEQRLDAMLEQGFVEEVRTLRKRPGLHQDSPSMRSVGYRQLWAYLDGDGNLAEARDKALFATRQLAKRQITWLRSEPDLNCIDPLEPGAFGAISALIDRKVTS